MRAQSGFTLIELLAAIAVIAVLATLIIPALGRSAQMGQTIKCMNIMRSWASGIQMYMSDHQNLPMVDETNSVNWQELIGPYLVSGNEGSLRFVLRRQLYCPEDDGKKGDWRYGTNNYLRWTQIAASEKARIPRNTGEMVNPARVLLLAEEPSGGAWNVNRWSGRSGIDYDRHGGRTNIIFGDFHSETLTEEEAAQMVLNNRIILRPTLQ